jgi:hypothetical protein
MKHCAGPAPESSTPTVGQPFFQSVKSSNSVTFIALSVTVKTLTCGISAFPFTIDPESGVGNAKPARAGPGKQFCRGMIAAKNAGEDPIRDTIGAIESTTLTASGHTYGPDYLSEAIDNTLNQNAHDKGVLTGMYPGEDINPGATATFDLVWQVPTSATAESLDFPSPQTTVAAR